MIYGICKKDANINYFNWISVYDFISKSVRFCQINWYKPCVIFLFFSTWNIYYKKKRRKWHHRWLNLLPNWCNRICLLLFNKHSTSGKESSWNFNRFSFFASAGKTQTKSNGFFDYYFINNFFKSCEEFHCQCHRIYSLALIRLTGSHRLKHITHRNYSN